jgi:hypothetical protein
MAEFDILIAGNTDPVYGKWNEVEDFVGFFELMAGSFPDSYGMKVTLLTLDHHMEDTTPLAEMQYLKDHSVYELLDRLRALPDQDIGVEGAIHEAILMISALNAVKVVGAPSLDVDSVVVKLANDPDLAAREAKAYPESMRALRDMLVDMDLGPSSRDL